MAYVYKLIFEISVYYGISGYYMQLYLGSKPSLIGMLLLSSAVLLYWFAGQKYGERRWRGFLLLLPCFTILAEQELAVLIHLLPAWGYSAYCAITEKRQLTYLRFRKTFTRSLLLFLAFIPPLINDPAAEAALSESAFYVIVWLLLGVSCIRCLREKQENVRQLLILLGATALFGLLTFLGVPQFLMKCLNDYVIQVLINGLMIIGLLIASLIFSFFDWLMSINGPPKHSNGIALETESIAEIMGIDPSEMTTADAEFFWLNMVLYIVGALVILIVLFILVRKLIKSAKNRLHKDNQTGWSVEKQMLRNNKSDRLFSGRKPQEPRALVRYYYAKYMRQCLKRGVKLEKDWTSEELAQASKPYFSEEDILQMEEIYRRARYQTSEQVPHAEAKHAAKLWQSIKKAK